MNKAFVAGAIGLGFLLLKKKKPVAEDFQSVNVVGPGGVPIKVTTPVPTTVTKPQVTGTPDRVPTKGKPPPVPTTVPGKGDTYSPPGTIQVTPSGQVLQPPPIIVSPAGAASIGVGDLKDVQRSLNTLGYAKPPLAEDGKNGPLTVTAIRAFQAKVGLVPDGSATPALKAALSAALSQLAGGNSAAGATAQNSNPASGTATTPSGQVVDTKAALAMTNVQVQKALNLTGAVPKLEEDGKLGPRTIAALKSFQAANGLVPDGIVGPKTKTALYLATIQATR